LKERAKLSRQSQRVERRGKTSVKRKSGVTISPTTWTLAKGSWKIGDQKKKRKSEEGGPQKRKGDTRMWNRLGKPPQ